MTIRSVVLTAVLASACGSSSTPTAPPATAPESPPPVVVPAPTAEIDELAKSRAQDAMKTLGINLKGKLVSTMGSAGPLAAMEVCAQDAQSLTSSVAGQTGVRVGRSSSRLRNPGNAGPEWVMAWLNKQGERTADGVQGSISAAELDDGTRVVRVLAPLPIEAPCLVCHGPDAGRAAELSTALADKYPHDQATGYALGDLRGAIWAEAAVVDAGLDLERNGSARWPLDESTRAAITEIRVALQQAPPTDLATAHALAKHIDASISRMIEGCTMDGPAHDQLHRFLEAFFVAIDGLRSSADLAGAHRARWLLEAQVVEFDDTFE